MSQRGIRPWSLIGHGTKVSKHSRRGLPKHRASVMQSFARTALARVPHPVATAKEAYAIRHKGKAVGEWPSFTAFALRLRRTRVRLTKSIGAKEVTASIAKSGLTRQQAKAAARKAGHRWQTINRLLKAVRVSSKLAKAART